MELSERKREIHTKCLQVLLEKTSSIKMQIAEINRSFTDESKSSAGDKHETARAMAQLEVEKLAQQLQQFESQIGILKKLDPDLTTETIQTGSLIKTDKGSFYIAVPLGKMDDVMVISAGAPLGKLFLGKRMGEIVGFNGLGYGIEEVI